ncbi:hypothetical protein KSF_052140 [Reticulibacter mediterranei]|uniref:Uncharacterized protein n=1 Tax=Reticulibacter mediterranei TaxID=2778369 RepID=A0A8J3ITS6_9CHLR|nr:hypothetical protein KSF_052140 [Reticulibacter mediterranei]
MRHPGQTAHSCLHYTLTTRHDIIDVMKTGLSSAHAEVYLDYHFKYAARISCHATTERYLLTAG